MAIWRRVACGISKGTRAQAHAHTRAPTHTQAHAITHVRARGHAPTHKYVIFIASPRQH